MIVYPVFIDELLQGIFSTRESAQEYCDIWTEKRGKDDIDIGEEELDAELPVARSWIPIWIGYAHIWIPGRHVFKTIITPEEKPEKNPLILNYPFAYGREYIVPEVKVYAETENECRAFLDAVIADLEAKITPEEIETHLFARRIKDGDDMARLMSILIPKKDFKMNLTNSTSAEVFVK